MTKLAILSAEKAVIAYKAIDNNMKYIAVNAGIRLREQRKFEDMGMTSKWIEVFADSGGEDAWAHIEDAWTQYLALAGVLTALASAAEERILTADEHRARFRSEVVRAATTRER